MSMAAPPEYLCPVCKREFTPREVGLGMTCSGSFLDADHPSGVHPEPRQHPDPRSLAGEEEREPPCSCPDLELEAVDNECPVHGDAAVYRGSLAGEDEPNG